jgi:ABC-2 type transport system permease protein
MSKTWLVARQTYRRRIRSSNFLILTFGLPVLMIVAGALPSLLGNRAPLSAVGVVDETGSLSPPGQVAVGERTVQVQTFGSADAARAAYEQGVIGGYLVVPAGYRQGAAVVFYGADSPDAATQEALADLLREALLPGKPPSLYARLADPANLVYVALNSGQQMAEGPALIVRVGLPVVLAILFALAVFMGSTQMGAAVVREKDQRAIEMVVTSLRVRELVAGKILGVSLLTLTQFGIWGVGAAIGAGLALSRVTSLPALSIPWRAVAWAVLLGVPGYFLYGAVAAGLGVIAGDSRQARQLAGVLGLVALTPFWFAGVLLQAPDRPIAVALTLFPLTSPMFSLFRLSFTTVPTWQLAAGLGLIVASLGAAVWFVAHIFRAAMLNYGKGLRPEEIVRALRQA